MAVIRHIGLKAINGPLIILDNIENASFDELVKIKIENQQDRRRLFYIFIKKLKKV